MSAFWGIVNLTPNSFSDGGELTCIDQVESRLRYLKRYCNVFDLGAESTAPFNDPIGIDTELERFEKLFFPLLKNVELLRGVTLSVDSYHPKTVELFIKQVRHISTERIPIIWNDVSGIWDDEVERILTDYKVDYVFSHTHVPERERTANHMDFVVDQQSDEFLQQFFHYFDQIKQKSKNYKDQLIFDPCFGFSKNYEQNWQLLNSLSKLVDYFSADRVLLGISRKSFLKKYLQESTGEIEISKERLDRFHKELLEQWYHHYNITNWDFRVHNPSVFSGE